MVKRITGFASGAAILVLFAALSPPSIGVPERPGQAVKPST